MLAFHLPTTVDKEPKNEHLSVLSYKTDTFNTTRYSFRLVPLDDEKYSYRADRMTSELCFYKKSKKMEIIDIIVSPKHENRGNGNVLLRAIDKICKIEEAVKCYGMLSYQDKEHWDKLFHFYEENGYIITLKEGSLNGSIVKEYSL